MSKQEEGKCWLCNGENPDTVIKVARDVPNGKKTKLHEVKVHFGCYMDMKP